jgi:lipopolysaccharide export system permease protein
VNIITRHVLRAHLGPFLFAFTAVTGLLFLNAVAQRVEDLAGKGLDLAIVGEFMLLSLPHIVALTLPMSILVATLYAFAEMTGSSEIAAMAAGGVHPSRLLVPLVGAGLLFTGAMYVFNDRILPESNHRLTSLLSDVGSKSPAFQLEEEIINPIHTADETRYFLRARSIDATTGRLEGVTIYDLSRPDQQRTIVAERGQMGFTEDGRDLFLTLEDGMLLEVADDRPGSFQRLEYETQILPLRGVAGDLERQGPGGRGDREMTIAQLRERVEEARAKIDEMAENGRRRSLEVLDHALGLPEDQYAQLVPEGVEPSMIPRSEATTDEIVQQVAHEYRTDASRLEIQQADVNRHLVEIHKKYAISFACLLFVLLGPPIAVRYPQGGAGMAIAVSVSIFFVYWAGLLGGEELGNRGWVPPWLGMWAVNGILLVPAVYMVSRLGGSISSNRGKA